MTATTQGTDAPGPDAPGPDARGAVVLGAAGGIGSAIVQALLGNGFHVAAVDTVDTPAEFADADRVRWIAGDATDPAVCDAAFGALPVPPAALVHSLLAEHRAPLAEQSASDLVEVYRVGAASGLYPLQELVRRAGGAPTSAVLVSSVHAAQSQPGQAPYAMAKAALEALSRAAAVEWVRDGLRCNSIRPGFVAVPRNARRWRDDPAVAEALRQAQPSGRLCTPDEIAEVARFLLSHAARFISGANITVDGAQTVVLPDGPQPPAAG